MRPPRRRADARADRRAYLVVARRHGLQRPRAGDSRSKGEYKDLFANSPARVTSARGSTAKIIALADNLALDRQIKHDIEVVIDRLKAGPNVRARLAEAVEAALKKGDGTVIVAPEGQPDLLLSSHYACASCGISFDPPSPQLFSFKQPPRHVSRLRRPRRPPRFRSRFARPRPLAFRSGKARSSPPGAVKDMGRWRRHIF